MWNFIFMDSSFWCHYNSSPWVVVSPHDSWSSIVITWNLRFIALHQVIIQLVIICRSLILRLIFYHKINVGTWHSSLVSSRVLPTTRIHFFKYIVNLYLVDLIYFSFLYPNDSSYKKCYLMTHSFSNILPIFKFSLFDLVQYHCHPMLPETL